ncbi:TniQ family protein [Streptomyces poriticola]|uniref:TniQ family protein n=1 Tax=Streptomyces poriticola TaxID=3120506 RepID=UPI002FCDF7A9
MEPWDAPARLLPVALQPVHGEVLGSYLHRLAAANRMSSARLGQYLSPHSNPLFTRRTDALRRWTPTALPRLATMTGVPIDVLQRSLPAFARLAARANGTGEPIHAHYDLYVVCRLCMLRHGIHEPVLAHMAPALRLCRRHTIWLDGACHPHVGHLDGLIKAQRQHFGLVRRFPDTIDMATKEAEKLIRSWLITNYQPVLQKRWQKRLVQLPREEPRYSDVARQRHDEWERIVTYPEFVSLLGLIADPRWRAHRIPTGRHVSIEDHRDAISVIFAEAERRLSVPTLRVMPERRTFHNDPLFRWTNPRGRVHFPCRDEPHTVIRSPSQAG